MWQHDGRPQFLPVRVVFLMPSKHQDKSTQFMFDFAFPKRNQPSPPYNSTNHLSVLFLKNLSLAYFLLSSYIANCCRVMHGPHDSNEKRNMSWS